MFYYSSKSIKALQNRSLIAFDRRSLQNLTTFRLENAPTLADLDDFMKLQDFSFVRQKCAKNHEIVQIRERRRIFLWFHKKCTDARGSVRFHHFLHIFVGATPQKKSWNFMKSSRGVKIRERQRIFETKFRQTEELTQTRGQVCRKPANSTA